MGKRIKIIILSALVCSTLGMFLCSVKAASGQIVVHYLDSSRKPTYTYTKQHGESMGYTVYGYQDSSNANILNQLQSSVAIVMHSHGSPGVQSMGSDTHLAGKNGNGGYVKSIDSLASNSMSQMRIAIYYGCETGKVHQLFGDICQETVNKGAQTAVAWKVSTVNLHVNEWNRLFFEKAKTDNIVESFRHADYWLRSIKGDDAADRMQLTRNEKGNIYGYVK